MLANEKYLNSIEDFYEFLKDVFNKEEKEPKNIIEIINYFYKRSSRKPQSL
jgi:hypothetical protein